MGGRALPRLDQPKPATGQGLRRLYRLRRGLSLRCLRHAPHSTLGAVSMSFESDSNKEIKAMDKAIAKQVSALMLEYGAKLDESINLVMAHCTEEEFKRYRRSVGHILGHMLLE